MDGLPTCPTRAQGAGSDGSSTMCGFIVPVVKDMGHDLKLFHRPNLFSNYKKTQEDHSHQMSQTLETKRLKRRRVKENKNHQSSLSQCVLSVCRGSPCQLRSPSTGAVSFIHPFVLSMDAPTWTHYTTCMCHVL